MPNTEHTPGPGEVRELEVYAKKGLNGITGEYICETSGNARANARLIAASPVMYDYVVGKADSGDKLAKEIISLI